MSININHLTEAELTSLNRKIIERLKFITLIQNQHEMMQFSPGEKISFEPPGRGRMVATLVRFNKKTVSVITENGEKWNVSAHLLSKIKNVSSVNRNKADNILEFNR